MKSLLKVLVLPSLILVLGSVGGPNVASGAYAYRTPRYAGQTYNAGDHQLRFIQATVRGINFTVNELSAEARRIVNAARASNAPTHVWDDNWYQKFVPENGSEYLLIIAHDLTAALSRHSLNIASAYVATFGERAVDVFYVTDLMGAKIQSAQRQAAIRKVLTGVLEDEGGR